MLNKIFPFIFILFFPFLASCDFIYNSEQQKETSLTENRKIFFSWLRDYNEQLMEYYTLDRSNYIVLKYMDKYGFVDKDGNYLIEPQYDIAFPFSENLSCVGYFTFKAQSWVESLFIGKFGYIDYNNEFIINPKFTFALPFSEGLAPVTQEQIKITRDGITTNNFGYIGHDGEYVIPPQFNFAYPFSEGFAQVMLVNNYGYINKNGKIVIPPKFARCQPFHDGLAAVQPMSCKRWGYIDLTGNYVIEPLFSEVKAFSEKFAPVKAKSGLIEYRWGYIDQEGNYLIRPIFSYAGKFQNGAAYIEIGKYSGYVNGEGKWASNPDPHIAGYLYSRHEIMEKLVRLRSNSRLYEIFDEIMNTRGKGNIAQLFVVLSLISLIICLPYITKVAVIGFRIQYKEEGITWPYLLLVGSGNVAIVIWAIYMVFISICIYFYGPRIYNDVMSFIWFEDLTGYNIPVAVMIGLIPPVIILIMNKLINFGRGGTLMLQFMVIGSVGFQAVGLGAYRMIAIDIMHLIAFVMCMIYYYIVLIILYCNMAIHRTLLGTVGKKSRV